MPNTPFTFIRSSAIILGLTAASTCFGSTVYLASNATETKNNSGSATVNISTNPAWSAALAGTSWVSNIPSGNPSGEGFISPANGTEVTFTDTFTIKGTPTYSDLIVMADDTASVSLNGVLLESAAPTTNNTYKHCSDFTIGCTTATAGIIDMTKELHSGINVLSFTVEQLAGSSFGLDYSGVIVSGCDPVNSSASPEPGTLALFGIPLAILGFVRRRKIKA